MKVIAVGVLLLTLLPQGQGSKSTFSSFTVLLSCYISYPCVSIIKICAVDPQTRWTRVRVAVVTAQTAVTRVSVTSTVSATVTAATTMKTSAKVSCTLSIHHFVPCQPSRVSVFFSQLVPRLVKAGVGRSTTLRTSATATPSAPSTATAAATMPTSVTVRPSRQLTPFSRLYHSAGFLFVVQTSRCKILVKS